MIHEKKILTLEFAAIILLWTLAVIAPMLFMDNLNPNWMAVHVMWAECIIIATAFCINRFALMPRLFFSKRYAAYIIALSITFLFLGLFVLCFDGVNIVLALFGDERLESVAPIMEMNPHHSMPPHGGGSPIHGGGIPPQGGHPQAMHPQNIPPSITIIPPNISILLISVIVIALDMGLSIAIKWLIAEQKQDKLARDRVSVQLSNLQNQVSPHFFMNTLNNIHALVEINPKLAQRTIIELSGLMDYLLYECSNQDDVSLKREMEFIRNYVSLMRLRYPKRVVIDLTCDDEIPVVKIPPLLFLNFIENTFKYGVDYTQHSFIKICFSFTHDHITMETINSNHSESVKSVRHGLGISNSRKRLNLIYGDKYLLKISEKESIYCVTLKIPIKHD